MNKKLSTVILSILICSVLLMATTNVVHAQTATPTAGVITLADLGKTEIDLNGPFDSFTSTFGLPADWKYTGDAQIDLNITTAFSAAAQADAAAALGGTLAISFNRTTIATLALNEIGTFDYVIKVPAALLTSQRTDGLMEWKFTLNSGISCTANQRMNVVINTVSRITFQYEQQLPDTSLINFPRPITQSSIFPDLALVVIPDKPTALELQSAYTVIAGLGNLSAGKLGLDLVTASQLTDQQKAAVHLIFVGNAASIPALAALPLPLVVKSGAFALPDNNPNDGIIQMINSPWSVRNVVLVVSGNSDLGTVKAAQAVSTGIIQASTSPNLAIVTDIQSTTAPAPLVSDQTFADLGYATHQFNNRGVDSQTYNFYVPTGSFLSPDAYLELAYGHSALLNYNLSGLVVLLNSQPIGSVRFDDESAGQAINRARMNIPSSVVLPGNNRLEVRASLDPLDKCTDPNLRGLWSVIWTDSRLYLPFAQAQLNVQAPVDLGIYPAPFIFDSTLATTAVIFQRNDTESWRTFTQVASYLGNQSNGSISKIRVFFDDELSEVDLSLYNLIVVGRPSQLKIMDKLNVSLPVPFEKGSDVTLGKFLQVTYQIPLTVPIGYVELMPSPWNSAKVLIAAFGNAAVGVNWGIAALADQVLRSQLAGDFALINDTRVQTVDTRLVLPVVVSTPVGGQTNLSGTAVPAQPTIPTPPANNRPAWLLPALIIVIGLIVIVIVVVVFVNLRNTRKNI